MGAWGAGGYLLDNPFSTRRKVIPAHWIFVQNLLLLNDGCWFGRRCQAGGRSLGGRRRGAQDLCALLSLSNRLSGERKRR